MASTPRPEVGKNKATPPAVPRWRRSLPIMPWQLAALMVATMLLTALGGGGLAWFIRPDSRGNITKEIIKKKQAPPPAPEGGNVQQQKHVGSARDTGVETAVAALLGTMQTVTTKFELKILSDSHGLGKPPAERDKRKLAFAMVKLILLKNPGTNFQPSSPDLKDPEMVTNTRASLTRPRPALSADDQQTVAYFTCEAFAIAGMPKHGDYGEIPFGDVQCNSINTATVINSLHAYTDWLKGQNR